MTVTITVNPANDAPVAVADSATVERRRDGHGAVVGGVERAGQRHRRGERPAYGGAGDRAGATARLTLNADGTFSYTHDGSETTSDSFTYTGQRRHADGNTVTVSITVTPVNDAPVAVADSATVTEGGTVTELASCGGSVLANDTDATPSDR